MNSAPPTQKLELVLLAGLLCDETIWADVAQRLADVARVTILGFDNETSIAGMAERVLSKAPSSFVLVGHSMGGRVALEVLRLAPGRVRALGLFNTGVHPAGEHEADSRGRLIALAKQKGMAALAAEWLPPMLDGARRPEPSLVRRLAEMVERFTPESFEGQQHALLNRPDAASVLRSARAPILLLSGTGDRWSPVVQHEAMRELAPHAELCVVDAAGHMAPAEQPDAVAGAIRSWLGRLGEENIDDVERLVIEARCAKLIQYYARLNDAGAFDELAQLYTEDAVFARPSEPAVHIRGRKAILESFLSRPQRRTRHIMAGIEIEVESTHRARARSAVLLFVGEMNAIPAKLTATLVGHFDDVLVRDGEGWRFSQRLGGLEIKS